MPTSGEQVGFNFLLEIDDTIVGGGTSHTITKEVDMIDIVNKESVRWNRRLPSIRTHNTDFDLHYLEDGAEFIGRGNALLEVDDGTGYVTVPGVTESTFGMELSVEDSGGQDKPRWRYIIPNRKDITLSFTANYIDPATVEGNAFEIIRTAKANSDTLDVRVTVAGATYEGPIHIGSLSESTDTDSIVPIEVEMMSQGAWTQTTPGNIDTGQGLLFANFFEPDPSYLSFSTVNVDGTGDPVDGATVDSGEALLTSLEVTMPDEEDVTISGSLTGHGPLSEEQQSTTE